MGRQAKRNSKRTTPWLALAALCALGATGCQVDVNGQTIPSPYYLKDDIQYFPPGPEYKLTKEAAALKEFSDSQAQQAQEGANR